MKKDKQSSAAIMLRSLMRFIIIVTLLLGAAIIIAVGHQLLEEVQTTTSHITASLKQTDIDGDDDWESWRKNSTLDTSATYVYVHNKRADAKVSQYFSPHAEKVLKVTPTKVPFFNQCLLSPRHRAAVPSHGARARDLLHVVAKHESPAGGAAAGD